MLLTKLSAFGDEVAYDWEEQLDRLRDEGIRFIEVRSAWGRNVVDLSGDELRAMRAELDRRDMQVSAIASPVGKSLITDPLEAEEDRLQRAIRAAHILGAGAIRVFSFYLPKDRPPEFFREEVIRRLRALLEQVRTAGVSLYHENEREIYGDTSARCADIMTALAPEGLGFIFDPANFVQVGERPYTTAFPQLAPYIREVHVKDARLSDGSVTLAGRGDGQLREVLAALKAQGFSGFLTLEPHLFTSGPVTGFTGPELFGEAVAALRQLLEERRRENGRTGSR